MEGHRVERISHLLQEKLGLLLLRRVKDPAVQGVTITAVRVSGDLSVAKVYFTARPEEVERAAKGLERAAPFLRRQLGETLRLRKIPELRFVRDEVIEQGERIDAILRELESDLQQEES